MDKIMSLGKRNYEISEIKAKISTDVITNRTDCNVEINNERNNKTISSPLEKIDFLRNYFDRKENSIKSNSIEHIENKKDNKTTIVKRNGYILEIDECGRVVKVIKNLKKKENKEKEKLHVVEGIKYECKTSEVVTSGGIKKIKIDDIKKTKYRITKNNKNAIVDKKEVVNKFKDLTLLYNRKMDVLDKNSFTYDKLIKAAKDKEKEFKEIGFELIGSNHLVLNEDILKEKIEDANSKGVIVGNNGILDFFHIVAKSNWDNQNASYGPLGNNLSSICKGFLLEL